MDPPNQLNNRTSLEKSEKETSLGCPSQLSNKLCRTRSASSSIHLNRTVASCRCKLKKPLDRANTVT